MLPSARFYDRIAPEYRDYAIQRRSYIASVDKYIIQESPQVSSILDIGSGDGIRAESLACQLGAKTIYLLDNSLSMYGLCSDLQTSLNKHIVYADITTANFFLPQKFPVITCLWNVLGHIAPFQARLQSLRNVAKLLTDDGILFLDVNNRYNVKAYRLAAIKNLVYDVFLPAASTDFLLNRYVAGETVQTSVHIATHREMQLLISQANLTIAGQAFINYDTGRREIHPFAGQLIYKVCK